MVGHPMLTPVYDLADGDKGFLTEILDSMAENIPKDINAIEQAIKDRQVAVACRSAHHMKSSIMYSNAEELKQLLSSIETKKDLSSLGEIEELMPKVKKLAETLANVINEERRKIN